MEDESQRSHETQRAIEDMAEEACLSLFDAYGVRLEIGKSDKVAASDGRSLSGIIGFTGQTITGMCLVDATEAPLAASNPTGGSLRDWVAELSNQLAGRLKHKLLAMGVEVYITTPIVLRATRIEPLPRTSMMPRIFHTDNGLVKLWVEVETSPDFQMVPGAAEEAVAEGETLLF